MTDYSEAHLVEQSAIDVFDFLDYFHLDCYHETFGKSGTLGRETPSDIVLIPRLKQSLITLNPSVSSEAIVLSIKKLTRDLLLPKLISGEIDMEKLDI